VYGAKQPNRERLTPANVADRECDAEYDRENRDDHMRQRELGEADGHGQDRILLRDRCRC